MLMRLIEAVRKWDTHTLDCKSCWAFDESIAVKAEAPCVEGLNALKNLLAALRDEGIRR